MAGEMRELQDALAVGWGGNLIRLMDTMLSVGSPVDVPYSITVRSGSK